MVLGSIKYTETPTRWAECEWRNVANRLGDLDRQSNEVILANGHKFARECVLVRTL